MLLASASAPAVIAEFERETLRERANTAMDFETSPDESLLSSLPLPLGQLYRRAHNAKTPLEQHLTAFYLWEAGLKLIGAAAIADYATGDGADAHVNLELGSFAKPTLGQWWNTARVLLPVLGRHDAAFQEVRELLFGRPRDNLPHASHLSELLGEEERGRRSNRDNVRLADLFEQVIVYRNREIGHGAGAQRATAYHERMAPVFLAAFAEVFRLLDPLARRELYILNRTHEQSNDRIFNGYRLVGETPKAAVFPVEKAGMVRFLNPSLVYLVAKHRTSVTNVSPLLGYDADGVEVLFLNRVISAYRIESLSYTTGRLLQSNPIGVKESFVCWLLGIPIPDPETATFGGKTPDPETPPPDTSLPMIDVAGGLGWEVPPTIGGYEVKRLIGEGGMARVYLAWQPSLGRSVAIKVFKRRFEAPQTRESFSREVQALARVDHPNLVKVYELGEEAGRPFYVMEYLEGRSLGVLAGLLSRKPSVLVDRKSDEFLEQVVRWMQQVVDALAAMHGVGLIHGDAKPSNIIVTNDGGRAVLIDPIVPPSDKVELIGTFGYMSPETLEEGEAIDPRSDVYSVGVVLWELLTGKKFRQDSVHKII